MGWTGRIAKTRKIGEERMLEDFNCTNDQGTVFRVVKKSKAGNVMYLAMGIKRPEQEEDVIGVVILTEYENGEFMYKEMTEESGPSYEKCPNSVLKALTPTNNEWALIWRKRCEEFNARKKAIKDAPIDTVFYANGDFIVKREPAYQFKTPWFGFANNTFACPKKQIEEADFQVLKSNRLEMEQQIAEFEDFTNNELSEILEQIIKNDEVGILAYMLTYLRDAAQKNCLKKAEEFRSSKIIERLTA